VRRAWSPPAADDQSDSDRRTRRSVSVCVFCSSADGLPEEYRSAARDLGAELARRGHRLVYGGGNVGLMGEVARSVHRHGGTVVGVIPQGLVDRELAYDPADELLVTGTLRDHNDTFPVKSSHSDKAAASRSRSPTTASSSATPRTAPARCSCSPLLSGMHSSTESATVSSTPPAPGAGAHRLVPAACAAPREPPPRRSPRTVLATYPRGRQDPTVLWPRLRGGSRCPIPHRSELRSLQRFGQPKPSVPTDRACF
jgi:hypothetical protein